MGDLVVFSPMPLDSGKGNAVSARRIAGLLADVGMPARATDDPEVPCDAAALVVLNSWRSAGVAAAFRQRCPSRPLIAVLTGTDIYPEFPTHPGVVRTLDAADAIVAWHDEVPLQLPERYHRKMHVIYKSAPDLAGAALSERRKLPPPPAPVDVLVIGHLRPVKDPFRAAEAARHLRADSRIHITHAGHALADDMASRATDETRCNPRYTWVGGIPREQLLARLGSAHLTVNSSFAEGGANAVIESLRFGVPVLASRIPGNTGLLGRAWPGLFTAGSSPELAALMDRCEFDPGFYDELASRTQDCAQRFVPEAEQAGWVALLAQLVPRPAAAPPV